MRFVLSMAVRETRASWRRLLFFFICIAVGVAAIVALRSVIQNVRDVFAQRSAGLIAADVLISTNREWTPAARQTIDRRLEEAGAEARTETIETPTMVRPRGCRVAGTRRPADGRAARRRSGVSALRHASGSRAARPTRMRCWQNHGALVRPELLTALDVEGRRSARHRQGGVHDSRRHHDRAGPPHGRLQPRAARADRPRRRAGRPACSGSAAGRGG